MNAHFFLEFDKHKKMTEFKEVKKFVTDTISFGNIILDEDILNITYSPIIRKTKNK